MILDDQAVDAAGLVALGLGNGEGDDVGDGLAVIGRAAGQRQGVDDADDDLAAAEDGFEGVRLGLEDRVWHRLLRRYLRLGEEAVLGASEVKMVA